MGRDAQLALVLVHGFRSSPGMWDPLRRLLDADDALGFVRVLPFGYATHVWRLHPLRAIPSFDTVADGLKEYVDTEAQGFGRLMLVAHSQGGLVVQRYLTRMTGEGRGADLARIGRVVLLACPNNGSQTALALRRRLVRRNPQERELRPLDERIADTQRAVLRDIVNAREVTARSCPVPFSVYAGESDGVVPPGSGRGGFPDAAVLPGDHFGIARPDSPQHRTYTTLRRLILLTAEATSPVRAGTPAAATPEGPSPGTAPVGGAYPFPDPFALVAAAERVSGMDDASFRLLVIRSMRTYLPAEPMFSVPYKDHPRDHLLEIIEGCRARPDARAALHAFRDVVRTLRPDEAATHRLSALVGDAG